MGLIIIILPCNQPRRAQGRSVGPARYRSWSPIHDAWYVSRIRRWRSSIGALGKPTGLRLSSRGPIFVGPKWPRFQHPSRPGNIQSAKRKFTVPLLWHNSRPYERVAPPLPQCAETVSPRYTQLNYAKFSATKFQLAR